MWQPLDSEVEVTTTGFPVFSAKMVDGYSLVKDGSTLTSRMQIELEYNSLR